MATCMKIQSLKLDTRMCLELSSGSLDFRLGISHGEDNLVGTSIHTPRRAVRVRIRALDVMFHASTFHDSLATMDVVHLLFRQPLCGKLL